MSGRIPQALRQQVWIQYNGYNFKHKCYIKWCKNEIDVFNFHVGHNIPRSKGGSLELNNLKPLCSACNLSMSDTYTIDEWDKLGGHRISCFPGFCFKTHRPVVQKPSKSKKSDS
jgi:5-methylcytosine-specific restriction endonuclease McrA